MTHFLMFRFQIDTNLKIRKLLNIFEIYELNRQKKKKIMN